MLGKQNILVLAPHTDDGEFGAGGSISRFLEEGATVHYAAFSTAQQSVRKGFPKNILEVEVKEATKRLGISSSNLLIYGFEVRKLNYSRQDILEILVQLKKDLNPDLVLMPSLNDLHQDHHTVSTEGLRAFKNTSILGYELPWNNITFRTECFIKLEQHHIDQKLYALDAYNSQKTRLYSSREFIQSLAITRGVQASLGFAEAFEVIRWII